MYNQYMPRRDTKFKTKVGIDIYNTLFSLYNVKKLGNSEMVNLRPPFYMQ